MTVASADTLTVINGPEDGTSFALAHRSFAIGASEDCAVMIRLDRLVREVHARAEVVSEGYRLRSARGATLFVNGRPVGTIRSRVARHGDIVRAGGTELVVNCTADGLAQRSRGIRRRSDLFWAGRAAIRSVAAASRSIGDVAGCVARLAWRRWIWWIVLGGVILYLSSPQFRTAMSTLAARARTIGLF